MEIIFATKIFFYLTPLSPLHGGEGAGGEVLLMEKI
jgi:hypothetical protein